MIYFEDGLINYFVHLLGKALYFLKAIGYYHVQNTESIANNKIKFIGLRL
jgi:hypothetical protein